MTELLLNLISMIPKTYGPNVPQSLSDWEVVNDDDAIPCIDESDATESDATESDADDKGLDSDGYYDSDLDDTPCKSGFAPKCGCPDGTYCDECDY